MAILTVKNRWHEPFIGVFDGETYTVVDTLVVPEHIAHHLKRQSVIRDNPVNAGMNEYRLAIVELNDVGTPLSELPQESLDRTDMDEFRKVVIKPSGIRSTIPASKGPPGQTVFTIE
jgi:hypothetical protein